MGFSFTASLFEEYQNLPGLNQSKLKQLLSSPSKQKQGYQIQQAIILETPDTVSSGTPNFEELYVCAPKTLSRRGKNGEKKTGKNFVSFTQEKMSRLK
ncbi:MAG: hypothetical protein Ct9H300mP28_25490 [Pseudomonadota bacterium]|nr:MAG: hypothetical protein Ct9H300mP28_25490 [Pseudomonadota bacterium]